MFCIVPSFTAIMPAEANVSFVPSSVVVKTDARRVCTVARTHVTTPDSTTTRTSRVSTPSSMNRGFPAAA